MMSKKLACWFCCSWLLLVPAHASQIKLDFEDIAAGYPFVFDDSPLIQDFYNGGTASNGSTGNDFGVSFTDNALAICLTELGEDDQNCTNASRGGIGDSSSAQTGLFFSSGSDAFLNIEAGFGDFLSFYYYGIADGFIQLFDGLDGSGNLLQTISLSETFRTLECEQANIGFCPFYLFETSVTGIAKSISFNNLPANSFIFDDLVLGEADVISVNAPASIFLIGFAFLLLAYFRSYQLKLGS